MKKIITILAVTALIVSCRTTLTKYGTTEKFIADSGKNYLNFSSMSKFTIKKEVKNNKEELTGIITSPLIKNAGLIGDVKINDNKMELYLKKMAVLANWPNGWTSGEYNLTGRIIFDVSGDKYILKIIEDVEIWELIKGEIRYYDEFFLKDEGLAKVQGRLERINVINKLFKTKENSPEIFGGLWLKTSYGEPYIKSVKKFLYKKDNNINENIVKYIKSGNFTRDIDEAPGLFILNYNFNYYIKEILNNSIFEEVKKIK